MNLHKYPELIDRLLAEYALGTLAERPRRRVATLIERDPHWQQRWLAWEADLLRLNPLPAPIEPPAHVWQKLERVISPPTPSSSTSSLWSRWLLFWCGGGALGLALLLALIVLPVSQEPSVLLRASLDDAPTWSLQAQNGGWQVSSLIALDIRPDQQCVLWRRGSEQSPAQALAILPDQGEQTLMSLALATGDEVFVTLEARQASLPQHPQGQARFFGRVGG